MIIILFYYNLIYFNKTLYDIRRLLKGLKDKWKVKVHTNKTTDQNYNRVESQESNKNKEGNKDFIVYGNKEISIIYKRKYKKVKFLSRNEHSINFYNTLDVIISNWLKIN